MGVCAVEFKRYGFDDVAYVSYCVAEEFGILDLKGESSITKGSKDFVDVLDVILDQIREDDDVLDVNEECFRRERITYTPLWNFPVELVKPKGMRMYWN